MALKFQYNKTALQNLRRQLAIREKALPTLKSKEAALRLEVRKIMLELANIKEELEALMSKGHKYNAFWSEFPSIVKVDKVNFYIKNIAGVKVPIFEGINYKLEAVSLFNMPSWVRAGIDMFKRVMTLEIRMDITERRLEALAYARKKTTQKVNLYEKIQIPEYSTAIIKIKRYMEDEENLSKSSQKIVKERNRKKEAEL